MIKFSSQDIDGDTVEVTTEANGLPEVLEVFERFLRAHGFIFDGHLEIVEDEE